VSRELKELWLFGPLRNVKDGEHDGLMEEDAIRVEHIIHDILTQAGEHHSGSSTVNGL
jgi:hypothetical protein